MSAESFLASSGWVNFWAISSIELSPSPPTEALPDHLLLCLPFIVTDLEDATDDGREALDGVCFNAGFNELRPFAVSGAVAASCNLAFKATVSAGSGAEARQSGEPNSALSDGISVAVPAVSPGLAANHSAEPIAVALADALVEASCTVLSSKAWT